VIRRDAALLLVVAAAWGSVYPLTAVALDDLAAPTLVVARTALAAVLLVPLALRRGAAQAIRPRLPAIAGAGLLQATIPLVLLTLGQQSVASGIAGILAATQPVWATAMTAGLQQSIRRGEAIGVTVGLSGVVVLLSDSLDGSSSFVGGGLVLGAAFFYAAGSVYIERVIPDVPPLTTATVAMVLSAIVITPFALPDGVPHIGGDALLRLGALGVVSTGAALVLFYGLIQRTGAIRANLVAYLAPAFAVLYGAVFLNENIKPQALAGLALIVAGSVMATRAA
jgi:drug/metabolite transporter (DMT)-like permease